MSAEKTYIFLLPTESAGCLLQLEPNLKINCVLPPTTRTVYAAQNRAGAPPKKERSIEIKTPTLLLGTFIHFYHGLSMGTLELYLLDTEVKEKIRIKSPTLPNVNGGHVCLGNNSAPHNLRQANNYLWGRNFNMETTPDKIEKKIEKAFASKVKRSNFEERYIKGTKYWATKQPVTGIMIKKDTQAFYSKKIMTYDATAKYDPANPKMITTTYGIAWATQTPDGWRCWTPDGDSVEIPEDQISYSPKK